MNTTLESVIGNNAGFENGLTVEHILLSVTIVSTKESAGQFDDSCAHQLKEAMMRYHGVVRVDPQVLYKHTKIENHPNNCECWICQPPTSQFASPLLRKNEPFHP